MPKFISDEEMAQLEPSSVQPKKNFISDEEMAAMQAYDARPGFIDKIKSIPSSLVQAGKTIFNAPQDIEKAAANPGEALDVAARGLSSGASYLDIPEGLKLEGEKVIAKNLPEFLGGMSDEDYQNVYGRGDDQDLINQNMVQEAKSRAKFPAVDLVSRGAGFAADGNPASMIVKSATQSISRALNEGESILSALGEGAQDALIQSGLTYGPKAAVSAARKAVNSVGPVSDYLLRRTGKVIADVPENYTQEYLDRGGQVSARPFGEIADELVGKANDSETAFTKAKDSLSEANDTYKNTARSIQDEFRDQKYEVANQLRDANTALNESYHNKVASLKGEDLQGLRGNIITALGDLKRKVVEGSNKAYDILESDPQTKYDVSPAIDLIDQGINDLKINNKSTVSNSASSSLSDLANLRKRLGSLENERAFDPILQSSNPVAPDRTLSGPQVKQILQQLDGDLASAYSANAGSFSPEAIAIKKQIRGLLDSNIKQSNPAYAEAMKNVAADTSTLSLASKAFGNDQVAFSRLNGLASGKGRAIDALILKSLGRRTGMDFETPVQDYIQKQSLLNDPRALRKNLPEYRPASQLESVARKLQDPSVARGLQDDPRLSAAASDVVSKEGNFDSAKQTYDLFNNVNQNQVQSKMKALTGARDYAPTKIFEQIDEATGKPFSREIKDRALLDSFEKGSTNGSRKTVLGGFLGSFFGPVGSAIGATAGAAADKYAGMGLKKALDTKINLADRLKSFPESFGKYAKPLQDAAARGGNALGVTHYLLQSIDPEYQKLMQKNEDDTEGAGGR